MRFIPLIIAASLTLNPAGARSQCSPAVQSLISAHRYDEARDQVNSQLKQSPRDDGAMNCMGRMLLEKNEAGKAVEWLEKAVKIDDRNALHHLWLGNALATYASQASSFKRPFIARRFKTEMEIAVSLDPTLVDARRSLVMFHSMAPGFMGGSIARAKEQANEIAKLNPMRGHTAWGTIAEKENDLARAEREFQAAIASQPDSIAGYYALGAFYNRRERWSESITTMEKAVRTTNVQTPNAVLTSTHYLLGVAYQKTGRLDRAKAEYEMALQVSPSNEDAKKALASIR
jgi:tetratricopeptide (TPR) repeat protein